MPEFPLLHNHGQGHDANLKDGQQQPQSLSSLLSTKEQRDQLLKLVVDCIDGMRNVITDTFDPRYAGTKSDVRWTAASSLTGGEVENEEAKEKELEELREQAQKRIKELSKPEIQQLKREALAFFDEWKSKVLGRVKEVITTAGPDAGQEATSSHDSAGHLTVVKTESAESDTLEAHHDPPISTPEETDPPVKTPLADLPDDNRRLVVQSLLLMLLSLECYTSQSRTLMLNVSRSLRISTKSFIEDETNVAKGLLKAVELNAHDITEQKAEEHSGRRKWQVGLAAAAGAAIIGVTGGLAAPLLAAGMGTVMGGLGLAETAAAAYLGSVAGSSVLIGGLFGAYGGRMTGRMMDDYAREVEDFSFVPLHRFRAASKLIAKDDGRRLRVCVGISGWLTDKADVVDPWRIISPSVEGFALKYEMEALLELGNAMSELLRSTLWSYAKKQILSRTIFAALKEALWPLSLMKVAEVIDNPWSVGKARSDKAGRVLADALIHKVQGERPVTLIGYSLGARVIYTCLTSLAERKAFGLLENVIVLGAPASAESEDWRKLRSVVSGRLVNVYSSNDMILAFLYRTSSVRLNVAGLRPTEYVRGVENVDVSDLVSGHLRYRYMAGAILRRIGFEDLDIEEVAREEDTLAAIEAAEEGEIKVKADEADGKDANKQADDLKRDVARKNEESAVSHAAEKLGLGHEKREELQKMGKEKREELLRKLSHHERQEKEANDEAQQAEELKQVGL